MPNVLVYYLVRREGTRMGEVLIEKGRDPGGRGFNLG